MTTNDLRSSDERQIAERLVTDVLARGFAISVFDSEETTLQRSRDKGAILAAMATSDSDTLSFFRQDRIGGNAVGRCGWVWLIYGNGVDLISDYSENPVTRDLVSGASALAESLELGRRWRR